MESGISKVKSGTTVVEFSTTIVKFSTSVLLMRIKRNQSRQHLFTSSPSIVRIRIGKFIIAIASYSIRSNLNDSNQTSYCGVRFLISYLKAKYLRDLCIRNQDYIFMLPPRQSFLWILQQEKHCTLITSVFSTIVLYCMAWKTWVTSEDWKKLIWISEAFDITFPAIPCSILSVDAMDISGEQHLDIVGAANRHMAYIMDTNEEERVKGITVGVGRAPFEIERRRFTILEYILVSWYVRCTCVSYI
ncbi:hypothetical protein H5410_017368 [Solanum commersonii]|uniref:Endoplasmic reticulum vesicle transporter N-terminal domain-containing protein n=1 Tax=Solanum commersonii TaxID=4109 RepID=A0A9J5ZZ87_SOLCO|nr:hypothetical protein H5410_017368 [Solanum commersonii]